MLGITRELAERPARRRSQGQGVVEFALVAPLLLLVLLITIEFGQAFYGWLAINNASRVGADYAAKFPDAWSAPDSPLKVQQRADYSAAITGSLGAQKCTPLPFAAPTFEPLRVPGSIVQVDLACNYRITAPGLSIVLGNTVRLSGSTRYPITGGCIANCGAIVVPPITPDPATPACRTVPTMTGVSVAGARLLWASAGFVPANFSPATGVDDRTVGSVSFTRPADATTCPTGQEFFATAVTATVVPRDPPPTPTCVFVPNLKGMTVAGARLTWSSSGLGGTFAPASGQDDQIVTTQTTDPVSQPDQCVEPPMIGVSISYAAPPSPPPPPPCKVPSLVNTPSGPNGDTARGTWTGAGFTSANLTFKNPQQLPYTIGTQDLVGGSYQPCGVAMQVTK
jgi:TadE-like protein